MTQRDIRDYLRDMLNAIDLVQVQLVETKVLSFPIVPGQAVTERENPWIEFIGMYEGDPDFAEIMAEIRAERGLEPHPSIE
jgi:hypothetical protein